VTDRDLLESMSKQMGELVRNVAEVRRSNKRLEADMVVVKSDIVAMKGDIATMQGDIVTMKGAIATIQGDIYEMRCCQTQTNDKIDERAEFLSTKTDHFVEFVSAEIMKNRVASEEQRHLRDIWQRRIERRLEKLEAAGAVTRE